MCVTLPCVSCYRTIGFVSGGAHSLSLDAVVADCRIVEQRGATAGRRIPAGPLDGPIATS